MKEYWKNIFSSIFQKMLVKVVRDTTDFQLLKITDGLTTIDNVERYQEYGFTSFPPEDAQAIVALVGGSKSHPIIIKCEYGQGRKKLSPNEVAMYSKHANSITLKANGDIVIEPKTGQVIKLNGNVEVTGSLEAAGEISTPSDIVAGTVSLKLHIHPETNASNTGTPVP
jgi:phage gp45-like